MPWVMVYITVAVSVLSAIGTWSAKTVRPDTSRLMAIVAAAALWPVLVVGLLQLGAIALYARSARRRTPAPIAASTAPRVPQRVGADHPA